jgi:hypothetical protein
MKTLLSFALTGLLLILGQLGMPQGKRPDKYPNAGGLYASFVDFQQGRLTYPIDCENSEDRLKLNDWFGSSRGYIWSHGEKHSFDKNRVYGYRDCKKVYHRFFQGEAYRILDTTGFYLYYRYGQEEINKGKGLIKTDEYYFSTCGDGTISRLTSQNLQAAFYRNPRFQYALDASFRSDQELIAYDGYQKTYKIKYLYRQSLK